MIRITDRLTLYESEIKLKFTRSSRPGGQNINKVSTAVQLHVDLIHILSLPEDVRRPVAHPGE